MEPIAVRPAEAARISGISRSALYEAIADGDLKSAKVKGCRLIFVDDLRAWLDGQRQASAGRPVLP